MFFLIVFVVAVVLNDSYEPPGLPAILSPGTRLPSPKGAATIGHAVRHDHSAKGSWRLARVGRRRGV